MQEKARVVVYKWPPRDGERFTAEAGASVVGQTVGDGSKVVGRVVAAELDEDGGMKMTVQITDDDAWERLKEPNPYVDIPNRPN